MNKERNKKIRDGFLHPPTSTFEKSWTVATILAGLTIAVLTFLLPVDEKKLLSSGYKEWLLAVTGIAATFLIMSVFAIKVVLVENLAPKRTIYGNTYLIFFCAFAFYTYEAGFSLLAILLPLLIYPFSHNGAWVILAIEILWAIIFGIHKCLRFAKSF